VVRRGRTPDLFHAIEASPYADVRYVPDRPKHTRVSTPQVAEVHPSWLRPRCCRCWQLATDRSGPRCCCHRGDPSDRAICGISSRSLNAAGSKETAIESGCTACLCRNRRRSRVRPGTGGRLRCGSRPPDRTRYLRAR
jgi:hypothetical protein